MLYAGGFFSFGSFDYLGRNSFQGKRIWKEKKDRNQLMKKKEFEEIAFCV